ncbi:related to pyridoxal kinase [Armillaria ostoyae]|uniref:pyridoxal kinase n=1 Tax=Armillaria ostoyae TaxID=47428 RepID=A0A284RYN1_ARMOS|nr:related to pyridoxal kinase [Armillaria ostoyae]
MVERILSIQSHVAFGYVGGKAAVFPLQCLGYDVDVVNTVNFSNHAGYRRSGGSKTNAAELNSIFESMEANGLLSPTRLLTGYIPGAEALTAIGQLAAKLKKRKPELIYLLDPVMGDAGRLYVAPDVVPVYQSMLSLASVITPNWFEAETLTNTTLHDLASLRKALTILHKDYGVPNVVISSIPLTPWLADLLPSNTRPPPEEHSDHLLCMSSSWSATQEKPTIHAGCVPLILGYFSGVGDLFSALLLGQFKPEKGDHPDGVTPLSSATSHALTKTHAVLTVTHKYSETLPPEERQASDEEKDDAEPMRRIRRMRGRELRLVQCQEIIRGVEPAELREMHPWIGLWDI